MEAFDAEKSTTIGKKLAPFNPTSVDCIGIALDMMQIRHDDRLYDWAVVMAEC